MDSDKPVPVVTLPPVRFIGGPTNQGRTGNIQGACYPEISVAVITTVSIPVEDDFDDIGMNSRKVVIRVEYDGKSS